MQTVHDLVGFGTFMASLWNMLPFIIQQMILAVAALSIAIGAVFVDAYNAESSLYCCRFVLRLDRHD